MVYAQSLAETWVIDLNTPDYSQKVILSGNDAVLHVKYHHNDPTLTKSINHKLSDQERLLLLRLVQSAIRDSDQHPSSKGIPISIERGGKGIVLYATRQKETTPATLLLSELDRIRGAIPNNLDM